MNLSLKKIVVFLLLSSLSMSLLSMRSETNVSKEVKFTVRGNGKYLVELGIGSSIGYGSCCSGVSQDSYVTFKGKVGDVLWDSKTKRVLLKVYEGLEGETVDLRQYY
ncbi:MAG: hypothetical protein ACKOA1_05735 [Bacteroidota bacterium]